MNIQVIPPSPGDRSRRQKVEEIVQTSAGVDTVLFCQAPSGVTGEETGARLALTKPIDTATTPLSM